MKRPRTAGTNPVTAPTCGRAVHPRERQVRPSYGLAAFLVLLTVGCSAAPARPAGQGQGAVTVKDCQGEDITFTEVPERAVTLDG